jgi:hypothetical protein
MYNGDPLWNCYGFRMHKINILNNVKIGLHIKNLSCRLLRFTEGRGICEVRWHAVHTKFRDDLFTC